MTLSGRSDAPPSCSSDAVFMYESTSASVGACATPPPPPTAAGCHATLAAAVGVGCGQERAAVCEKRAPCAGDPKSHGGRPHSRRSTSSLASLAHPSSIVWSAPRALPTPPRTPFPPARRRRRRRRPRPSQQSARRSTSLRPAPRVHLDLGGRHVGAKRHARPRPRPRAELRIRRAARPTEHRAVAADAGAAAAAADAAAATSASASVSSSPPASSRLARITAAVSSLPRRCDARRPSATPTDLPVAVRESRRAGISGASSERESQLDRDDRVDARRGSGSSASHGGGDWTTFSTTVLASAMKRPVSPARTT